MEKNYIVSIIVAIRKINRQKVKFCEDEDIKTIIMMIIGYFLM